jgi:hypothetical protein
LLLHVQLPGIGQQQCCQVLELCKLYQMWVLQQLYPVQMLQPYLQ